jgi:hypothetical protein
VNPIVNPQASGIKGQLRLSIRIFQIRTFLRRDVPAAIFSA